MNRNIAKPFEATLSLLDVASDRTHKYKCFHGEDVQLTVKVVGENQRPIDLSNTSVKIYFALDKNLNEPIYRQDTGIVVNNLGIITVMLEKSYIRIGNNTLKIVLYDEDQTVFLQPLIISCIDPLIGELSDLEIPDDIDVRDELYDIRRIIGDLQDFDDDLGREIIEARNEHGPMEERLDNVDVQLEQNKKKTNNILTPEMFGAVGDGETDDSDAIQSMIDSAKSGQRIEFKSNTKYKITKTINIPITLEVDGCGCFIIMGSELAGQYAFNLNNSKSNAVSYTSLVFNEFKNFNIQHYGDVDGEYYNGIFVGEQCYVKNIYTWGLDITVKVSSDIYLDIVTIEGINIWNKWGTNYAIHTGMMGDCRVVKNVHFYHQNTSEKIIYVGNGHNTCKVEGIINGDIYIGSSMVELNNLHLESGYVTFNNSYATMKNMYILAPPDNPSIVINGTTNLIIENCLFNYYSERDYSSSDFNDIQIENTPSSKIHIKNCFKNMSPQADVSFRATNGIRIKDLEDFNKNSLNNSIDSIIKGKKVICKIDPSSRTEESYPYLSQIYSDANFKWNSPTRTYYYKCCLVYDETRKIGKTWCTEMEKVLTENGSSALLFMSGVPNSNVKLYRGKTKGLYNSYAMLSPCTTKMYDRGTFVNGTKWEDRSEGDIDTYLSPSTFIQNQDGTVTIWADSTPTTGTWQKRDRIYNNNIASGNVKSWVFNGTSWISEGKY